MIAATLLSTLLFAAAPQTPGAHLERAQAFENDLEYERAADELLIVITSPDATEEQLIEANLLAGIVKRVLGNNTEARLHFLYVLKRRPETTLDSSRSPKIRTFFDLVREEVGASEVNDAPPLAPDVVEPQTPDPIEVPPPQERSLLRPTDERNLTRAANDDEQEAVAPEQDRPAARAVAPRSPLPALFGGGVLASAGIGVAAASLAGAIFIDPLFYDTSRSAADREGLQLISRVLVGTTVAGGVAAIGGAGLMTMGFVE